MIQRARDRRLLAARIQWMVSQGKLPPAEFLVRDDFTSDDSAPLASPRTCEPGPGTLTLAGDANLFSIAAGILTLAGVSATDELRTETQTRAAGLAFYALSLGKAGRGMRFSVKFNNANPDRFEYVSGLFRAISRSSRVFEMPPPGESDDLQMVFVARSNGMFHLYRVGSGGAWLLAKAERDLDISSVANLSGAIGGPASGNDDFETIRVFQLGPPFDSDYGLAVVHESSYTAGAQRAMPADGMIEFSWTAAASEVLEISLRRTDDDNRWIVRCDQAGGTLKLVERNAGVESERSSSAQTWAAGTKYHILVRAYGQRIQSAVDGTARGVYASAGFNQSATGLKIDKDGSNLAVYAVALASRSQRELERFIG
jgi:hypothetical protein